MTTHDPQFRCACGRPATRPRLESHVWAGHAAHGGSAVLRWHADEASARVTQPPIHMLEVPPAVDSDVWVRVAYPFAADSPRFDALFQPPSMVWNGAGEVDGELEQLAIVTCTILKLEVVTRSAGAQREAIARVKVEAVVRVPALVEAPASLRPVTSGLWDSLRRGDLAGRDLQCVTQGDLTWLYATEAHMDGDAWVLVHGMAIETPSLLMFGERSLHEDTVWAGRARLDPADREVLTRLMARA